MHVTPPVRATHTYRQHLVAPPEAVFPLLCPVREADWIDGWDCAAVYSQCGVAEDECVFVTDDDGRDAVWVVTEFAPSQAVGFVKVVPGKVATRIRIQLAAEGAGTAMDVTYSHTALSAEGEAFVAAQTPEAYRAFMVDWETRLNHYLETGEMWQAESRADSAT